MAEANPTAEELKAMPIEEILRRMKLLMAELDGRTATRKEVAAEGSDTPSPQ
jgi:hypothetical protein